MITLAVKQEVSEDWLARMGGDPTGRERLWQHLESEMGANIMQYLHGKKTSRMLFAREGLYV